MASVTRSDQALLAAVKAGDRAQVRWLLDQPGVQVDSRSPTGTTPVSSAVDRGDAETVAMLLDAGANPRQIDADQVGLMDRAVAAGAKDVAAALALRGLQVDTAAAVVLDDVPLLGRSLGAYPLRPLLHRKGWSLLHVAARARAEGATRFLLGRHAFADARDRDGATPLHHCLEGPRGTGAEVARQLIWAGADPNATDDQGRGALHRAVANRDRTMLPLLLALGADPDHADCDGLTPLTLATRKRIQWAAKVLREG